MITTFLAMLEKGNDNALVRYSLGNAYVAEKQYLESIEHLQAAVQHDENYSAAWKLLGRAFFELEQFEDALKTYQRGIEIAASNGDKQAEKEMQVFMRRAERALNTD